jgi:hypothetical protein
MIQGIGKILTVNHLWLPIAIKNSFLFSLKIEGLLIISETASNASSREGKLQLLALSCSQL